MKYFWYQKPILSLSKHGSVLESEMIASNNTSFGFEEYDLVAKFLHDIITNSNKEFHITIDKNYWLKFAPSNITEQYLRMINGLLH